MALPTSFGAKAIRVFGWAKYVYMLSIPWLGYTAIMVTGKGPEGLMIGTGWLLVVIYQLFIMGSQQPGEVTTVREIFPSFVTPLLLILGQFVRKDGSLWNFFIEDSLTELVAMNVALLFLFGREMRKALATRQDIGPAVPGVIILVGFTGCVLYALFRAWWELHPHRNYFSVINLSAAFGISTFAYFRSMKRGTMFSKDKEPSIGLIVGQIFIWILAMPIFMSIRG